MNRVSLQDPVWTVEIRKRISGRTAGSVYMVYIDADGKQYHSRCLDSRESCVWLCHVCAKFRHA